MWTVKLICSLLAVLSDMRKALPRDSKRETVRDSQKGMNTVVDVQ